MKGSFRVLFLICAWWQVFGLLPVLGWLNALSNPALVVPPGAWFIVVFKAVLCALFFWFARLLKPKAKASE